MLQAFLQWIEHSKEDDVGAIFMGRISLVENGLHDGNTLKTFTK
jgi:hypothetical protein